MITVHFREEPIVYLEVVKLISQGSLSFNCEHE